MTGLMDDGNNLDTIEEVEPPSASADPSNSAKDYTTLASQHTQDLNGEPVGSEADEDEMVFYSDDASTSESGDSSGDDDGLLIEADMFGDDM
jgi:hypothetical protein